MNRDAIRLSSSFLAATVTLAMSQEWMAWAIQQRRWWKVGPGVALAGAAIFEAHQVWCRAERLLGM